MKRSAQKVIRQKKRNTLLSVLVTIMAALALLINGLWCAAILLLVAHYIFREAYLSDHIFYSVKEDYSYNLQANWKQAINLQQAFVLSNLPNNIDTIFLAIEISSNVRGNFFDPYVEVKINNSNSHSKNYRQYFERGAKGLRYINLTQQQALNSTGIQLSFIHCTAAPVAEALGFSNDIKGPDTGAKQNIMVIAPHADDAELAAFGFYSQHTSTIVTITAGETEAEDYESYFKHNDSSTVEASRLKGLLRSHDSLAASTWGGVPVERVVSLGYFCKQLSAMHASPAENIPSLTAGLSDTRYFRRFNQQSLASDAHGNSNWSSLVGDLKELITLQSPSIIITPHPLLDPHPDHIYSTRALIQALGELEGMQSVKILLYANHYHNSQVAPFGPSHSGVGLPPQHKTDNASAFSTKIYSITLDEGIQRNKALALQMMHDLHRPIKISKSLRIWIQKLICGREINTYGADDFFRRAVRKQEVFFMANFDEFER